VEKVDDGVPVLFVPAGIQNSLPPVREIRQPDQTRNRFLKEMRSVHHASVPGFFGAKPHDYGKGVSGKQ